MVSLAGAQAAAPLVATITGLQTLIAQLQAEAAAGNLMMWKISIDAYVGPKQVSQNFLINHNFTNADSNAIGTAILNALNAELTTAQNALAAIS